MHLFLQFPFVRQNINSLSHTNFKHSVCTVTLLSVCFLGELFGFVPCFAGRVFTKGILTGLDQLFSWYVDPLMKKKLENIVGSFIKLSGLFYDMQMGQKLFWSNMQICFCYVVWSAVSEVFLKSVNLWCSHSTTKLVCSLACSIYSVVTFNNFQKILKYG